MEIDVYDITAHAGTAEHCPHMRAELEAIGWQVLGRVRLGTEDELRTFMTQYDPDIAPYLLEKELVGATVLRDPQGTAFALVDWFFTCPYTRVLTMLDDGRLVQTEEAWTSDPVLQTDLRHMHAFMHRRREQTRDAASGRSIELVDRPSGARLAEAHRRHVQRVVGDSGVRPGAHRSIGQALGLWRQQHRHSMAVTKRVGRLAGMLPTIAICLVLMAVITWRFVTGELDLGFVVVMTVLSTLPLVVGPFLAVRLFTPLGYVHWLKPGFEGRPLEDDAPSA